jgi:hypothetical protein
MKASKARLILLASIALLAAAVLASLPTAAVAAEWFVAGKALSAPTELSATVSKPITLSVPAAKVKIECPNATFTKLEIFEKTLSQAEAIDLSKCKVIEPAGCTLVKEEITTEGGIVLTPTIGPGKSVTLVKTPLHGTTIVVLRFSTEACGALAGAKAPVTGKVSTTAPTLQEEKTEQKVDFEGETEGLTVEIGKVKDPVFLSGELSEEVASEKAWSFH